MALTRAEALELLDHPRSPQRRRGAKRLRGLADASTGPAVRAALEREVGDERTWETRYQMVMALAVTGSPQDVDWLKDLAGHPREATMVNHGLGGAIVRLGRQHPDDPEPALWCHRQDVDLLAEGAQRAVAVLQLVLPSDAIAVIAAEADRRLSDPQHPNDELGVWALIAAAGWSGPQVDAFLDKYRDDHRASIADAAQQARQGRYRKDSYL
ncbi:hypothetical protein [Modestobacter sp. VKM Ac-2984]|uniref:hypothetical protein n=1 Tax=Modestobacter sp. VKM Ac-2984 TaxID=3004138 RepID=UPI0022AAD5CE|nr:hypothetical protein [Modestobacter sp. VKM Ac-2984]MCZ2816767.1 hypothetical protein [Modestobacter sp. VKM Ac-2984]